MTRIYYGRGDITQMATWFIPDFNFLHKTNQQLSSIVIVKNPRILGMKQKHPLDPKPELRVRESVSL